MDSYNKDVGLGQYTYDLKQYVEWLLNELKRAETYLTPPIAPKDLFTIFMKEYCNNEQSLENNMMKRSRITSSFGYKALSKDVQERIAPYLKVHVLNEFDGDNWSMRYLMTNLAFDNELVIKACENKGAMLVFLLMINDYYISRKTNMCVFETDSRYVGSKSFNEILNGRCDLY